jgi:uncharacterized sulfatase
MKQMLFERSARAPLIIAAPGVSTRGHSSQRIVEFVDIYPTLVDLASLSPPPGLHGRSLTPLLRDPMASWDHPAVTQVRRGNATTGFMGYSVRTEQWRYTEWDEGTRGIELYDEKLDPQELRNLAADPDRTQVVEEMRRLLRTMRTN